MEMTMKAKEKIARSATAVVSTLVALGGLIAPKNVPTTRGRERTHRAALC
jgi:hypothetical protein